MATYSGYDFNAIRNPQLKRAFETIFDITTGHDHDGTNTKAVTAGTPQAGALTADANGRAIMANDYFDAATVLAKFDADSFDNAQLILAIKDGAFNADAATRALFDDGIWTLAKMADTAKTRIITYITDDLAAGVDQANKPILVVPAGFIATVTDALFIPLGTSAGIDDSNNCIVGIDDGTNSIAYIAYDTSPGFPAENSINSLGALDATYKVLSAGERLCVSITNGATANPPKLLIQVSYTLTEE